MEKKVLEAYQLWCSSPVIDESVKRELRALKGQEDEITDRFGRELEFGTGGLRGILGAGTNRMNRYTVQKATQGLANYILKEHAEAKGVVIAFDSRHMSAEFADEAAGCLAVNGIKVWRFESLRPTPELSFALRYLKAAAGIVITASHNPPQYNGYKVYWEDGAQVTSPRDRQIMDEVRKITGFSDVKTIPLSIAEERGLYEVIGSRVDDAYMEALESLILSPEAIAEEAGKLKIVYTPLHGAGRLPVQRILKRLGFKQIYTVREQEEPDGRFPTVRYPNPEDPDAFAMALSLAEETEADLVLATDPDADRLGVYVKADGSRPDQPGNQADCRYMPLTGNMTGILLCEYELSRRKELGLLPSNGVIVTTIVSTDMAKAVTEAYGISCVETLTGFKYIGEQIRRLDETGEGTYLFGFEESYGCLAGAYARDKDACAAAMLLGEAAAYYRTKGLTLWDQMMKIYEKYGYYKESLATRVYEGAEGMKRMKLAMEHLREHPLERVASRRVLAVRDYQKQVRYDCITGKEEATGLPASDVLYYELEGDAWLCVRPSGTEPKIKYYAGVREESLEAAERAVESIHLYESV